MQPRSPWLGRETPRPQPTSSDLVRQVAQFPPAQQEQFEQLRRDGRTIRQAYDEVLASWRTT